MFKINEKNQKKIGIFGGGIFAIFAIVFGIGFFVFSENSKTDAANLANFNPGNIIDDATFYNKNSMSAAQIQDFLNQKGANCSQNCLKNYSGSTTSNYTWPDAYCTGSSPLRTESAAEMIYDVAQDCGINPQVLLVMLQKEQGLITMNNPDETRYSNALGYGCPDDAPCSQSYGFAYQLYMAAWQFQVYRAKPMNYSYIAGMTNNIYYSTNKSCGTQSVFIENQATAALYIYTPYVPNQAALNAGYGTGDACSEYGNRNFYNYFNDWFGSTQSPNFAWQELSQKIYTDDSKTREIDRNNVPQGGYMYIEYTVKNIGREIWPKNTVLFGREADSQFCNEEWQNCHRAATVNRDKDIAPNDTATFGFWLRAPLIKGAYKEYWNLLIENKTWFVDIGSHYILNIVNAPQNDRLLPSPAFIKTGDAIYSPDKNSAFSLLNGTLTIYYKGKKVYNVPANNIYELRQQTDGNLVAYAKNGTAVWVIRDNAKRQLTISNNALFYATDSAENINIANWQTDGKVFDTLYADESLLAGQTMSSQTGKYQLILQTDGNLVLYGENGAVWSAGQNRGAELRQQTDGNLVLYNYAGAPIWCSNSWTSRGKNSAMVVQDDGNLVVYNDGKPLWDR